jgi:hypothetical protein
MKMNVKRMISMQDATELLGLSIRTAFELTDPDNVERDDHGKPLGVWLSEDTLDDDTDVCHACGNVSCVCPDLLS